MMRQLRQRAGETIGTNLSSGRQLKAARVLAGHTQESFAAICGYHVRSCIYWEAQPGLPTTNLHTLKNIEDALRSCGVVVFSDPAPGVRLLS
ncbi:MAG TPA: helix-turn-helix transcriptional regulator, partial [Propionibacteriaceae bacterium]|nr:helix-turn-helix transcriptional regulator [Propionibacteriaceae bacterium]